MAQRSRPMAGAIDRECRLRAASRELSWSTPCFALEAAGYPIVFTVHDEIVVEHPGHRQGNPGTDHVGAAGVGRKARHSGQGQGVGRQTIRERRCADATVNFGALKRAMAIRPRLDAAQSAHAGIASTFSNFARQIENERLSDHRRDHALDHPGVAAFQFNRGPEGHLGSLPPVVVISLELRRAGSLDVASFDLYRYADPLVHDIGTGNIRGLTTLEGFALGRHQFAPIAISRSWRRHLISLGVRDRCGVALLVPLPSGSSQKRAGGWCTSILTSPVPADVDGGDRAGWSEFKQRIAPAQLCLG